MGAPEVRGGGFDSRGEGGSSGKAAATTIAGAKGGDPVLGALVAPASSVAKWAI